MNGHFRKPGQDYSIKSNDLNGSVYIKPKGDRLIITCHPNLESDLIKILGEPDSRESPESINYAKWEVMK